MSTPSSRVSAGVPTGGQFASTAKGESGISLTNATDKTRLARVQESYAELRRTGRVILGYEERDRVLPALRRMAKAEGLRVTAMLSESGRGNKGMSRHQLRTRPTYVNLVHPDNPTLIYAPDATPPPLTAPPSTNPRTAPFGKAATLEALADHYEALTSPENISWDGERSGAAVQAEFKRLQTAYWARRDEIDPKRERAYCIACRIEVPGADGEPDAHDNDLGRPCWGGAR